MKKHNITALLLSACIAVLPVCTAAAADSLSEIQSDRAAKEAELETLKEHVSLLNSEKGRLSDQLSGLTADGRAMREEYDQLTDEMAAAEAGMNEAVEAVQTAYENVETQKNAYQTRLSTLFQYRHKSVLEVLLASDNLEGFFSNVRLMNYIADADQQLLENLMTAKEEADEQKAAAERSVEAYKQFLANKQLQLDQLSEGISLLEQDIRSKDSEIASDQEKAEAAELYITELDSRINAVYQELERRRAESTATTTTATTTTTTATVGENEPDAPSDNQTEQPTEPPTEPAPPPEPNPPSDFPGTLLNPLTGYHYVTSPYGPRVHPITGDPSGFHYGVDFNAGFGEPVRAAKGGTVVLAEASWQGQNYTEHKSGYGNYITIDHGDGTATTYAHLKYVEVSKGQYVSEGERIGQVGSTGASTGSHLHFEFAFGGSTHDPLDYIRSLSE